MKWDLFAIGIGTVYLLITLVILTILYYTGSSTVTNFKQFSSHHQTKHLAMGVISLALFIVTVYAPWKSYMIHKKKMDDANAK